jgi:diguanylate cyclase (GGDEF)-like protein/PAS domain S-box-containing protein
MGAKMTPASLPRRLLAPLLDRWPRERLLLLGPFVALGLVLVLMWGIVAWFSVLYPQRLTAEYKRELAGSAAAAANQTEAVLRDAESSLRTIDLWLLTRGRQEPLDDASLAQLAETLRDTSRGMVDVMLATDRGELYRLPGLAGQPHARLAEADAIHLQASAQAAGMTVAAPLRLHPDRPLQLPLALRMSAPAGELRLIVALVDLGRLAQRLQPYARGGEGAVTLLRGDGLGLMRVPELAGYSGRNMFTDQPQRRALLEPRHGTFLSSGAATDGLPRLAGFETVDDFNIKVVVGQGLDSSLASHAEQRSLLLLLSTAITAAALLITLALARMQRAARERDAALLATSHASPLGLFRCDAQGRMTYANETYLRLHGFGVESLAWGWLDMVPEAERAQVRERWSQRIGGGEAINARRLLRRPDGQMRLLSVRTAPLRVHGRVVGAAGTVDDITERAAQRKAEVTLNAINHQTPDYVAQFDFGGQLLYLNPAGRQLLGLGATESLAEVGYQRFFSSPQATDRFVDVLPPAALEHGHWMGRSAVPGLRGEPVPMAATVLVHNNERGKPETVSLILRDISVQVQTLRERERSEAMLKAVAEAADTTISVLDLEERFLFFNHVFAERFGVRREDWLGRPLRELLGEESYALSRPLIQAALAGQVAQAEKTYGNRPAPVVVELSYAPLRRDSGEVDGIIGIGRDITSLKSEQAKLRKASQTDPLTQLLNRSGFAQRADEQLALARQHNSLLALLYLDLDRFKPVNDQYGHPVGDALLRAVAGRLRHILRPQDLVARLGGDEFAVLLPALGSLDDAEAVAAKLVRTVGQPFRIDTHEISVGVSVGYCVAAGGITDLDRLVAQADAKLYDAKRAGRGRHLGGMLDD